MHAYAQFLIDSQGALALISIILIVAESSGTIDELGRGLDSVC